MVPQHGHGAVGEAARIVMVTSLVIHTCSITRSERSGMMVIGSHWIWKTSRWRICLVLQYTTCGISEPAEEPQYGSKRGLVLIYGVMKQGLKPVGGQDMRRRRGHSRCQVTDISDFF